MDSFRLHTLSESDLDQVIEMAGGRRAHPDADQRALRGADYLLADCVIELKCLDDDGLTKPERQTKLATLFRSLDPERPVIVLDRNALPEAEQRTYDRLLEGPIKTAISSAKNQLRQTRSEYLDTTTSILWIVNNGYTALDHDALVKLVAHRVRNDTSHIDGVIISGCYFYGDTFDSFIIWKMEYVPIHLDKHFPLYEKLLAAWNALSIRTMNNMLRHTTGNEETKGPVVDTQFDVDGVTFVMPTPPMGKASEFFVNGRPRKNSTGLTTCPPVAKVFAELSFKEWTRFKERLQVPFWLGETYEDWRQKRKKAGSGSALQPLVAVAATFDGWQTWAQNQPREENVSVHRYATELFSKAIQSKLDTTGELGASPVRPSRYVLVETEEIGQDAANDVSHIALATEYANGDRDLVDILVNQRLFHEYAVALACAYAIARDIEIVMWQKNLRYAWV